jgi:hypothetical protein
MHRGMAAVVVAGRGVGEEQAVEFLHFGGIEQAVGKAGQQVLQAG